MSTSNFLGGIFGEMPSYMGGLLGAEEQEKLRQQAQDQGLLNLGLSLLAGSGRSPVRRTTGELVAQGLQAGQQAYRGAMQQAVQDRMTALQLGEMAKKQRAEQALPGLIQGAMVAPQREFTDLERMEMRTPSVATGPARFDPQQFLQRATAAGVSPTVAIPLGQQIQSFTKPQTKVYKPGDVIMDEVTGQVLHTVPQSSEMGYMSTDQGIFAYDKNAKTPSLVKVMDAGGKFTGEAANYALSEYGTADASKLSPTQRQDVWKSGTLESKKASASSTKVVLPGEKSTSKALEKFGEQYPERLAQAVTADQTNQRLASIIENKNQKMYTGLLAPGQVAAAQFLQSFGVQVDAEKLANTRTSQATANQLVLDFMGAMGGAKGFSKEESAILYDSFPKIIDDPNSRARIAEMLIKRNNQVIDDFNSIRSSLEEYEGGRALPGRKISPFDLSAIKPEPQQEKKKPSTLPPGVRVIRER